MRFWESSAESREQNWMKRNWVHKRKIETIYVVWFLNSAQNLHCFPIFKRAIVRLPGGPAVNSVFTMQRTQVPSLVGEVRSHMPQNPTNLLLIPLILSWVSFAYCGVLRRKPDFHLQDHASSGSVTVLKQTTA